MKTSASSIVLVILCTIFTSLGQILWKLGVNNAASFDIISLLLNWALIAGFVSYGLGAILLVLALRGGELSVIYPVIASSYVWVSILSIMLLGESMSIIKWAGVFVIIIGILFITVSDSFKKGVPHGN